MNSVIHKCYWSVQTLSTSYVSERSFHFSSAAIITVLPLSKSFPSSPSILFPELLAELWPVEVGEHPAALCSLHFSDILTVVEWHTIRDRESYHHVA